MVSVGSLSAGGAGKTPFVLLLVEMLRSAGHAVDVLSRGYGRSGKGVERVEPAGTAARFGDEPMLLARRLAVPVWVGADRYAAGLAAETARDARVHVLDDGFQHRRLARVADIVLLTQADLDDGLLPAGNLREPLPALARAHVIVLREDEADALRSYVPAGKTIWIVRRTLSLAGAAPVRPLVFCGIARPAGFMAMLAVAGVVPADHAHFPDHHAYGMGDLTRLLAAARAAGADGFVTTAKDDVKLTPAMRTRLEEHGPVAVAELRTELVAGSLADLGGFVSRPEDQ